MSRETLNQHRAVWQRRPVLQTVYSPWFEALASTLPSHARAVELGAGPGLLAPWVRGRRPDVTWITSDLTNTPWNDLTADATSLPLKDQSVDFLGGIDVLHHIARPAALFAEAGRVLRHGGIVAVVEPWVTPASHPVYRFLHQEGCHMGLDPWNPFPAEVGGGPKDPFRGDAAVLRRMLDTTTAERWSGFGLDLREVRLFSGLAYLLSLGFRRHGLLPVAVAPAALRVDRALERFSSWLAFRALAVWQRPLAL